MAVNNVQSTLPDPKYIAALERELQQIRALVESLQGQIQNMSRGNR